MAKNRVSSPRQNHRRGASNRPLLSPHVKKELFVVVMVLFAIMSVLAFFGMAGPVGTYLDGALAATFGLTRFVFPIALIMMVGRLLFPERFALRGGVGLGIFLFFVGLGGLLNLIRFPSKEAMLFIDNISTAGGYVGLMLSYPLIAFMGFWAGLAVLSAILLFSLILTFNLSIHQLSVKILGLRHKVWPWPFGHRGSPVSLPDEPSDEPLFQKRPIETSSLFTTNNDSSNDTSTPDAHIEISKKKFKPISLPYDLLDNKMSKPTSGDINGRMMVIQKTLENFGIPVEMGDVSVGPTVTQFTLKPADGVKLARITALSNDLALSLAAHPIRIEAPIPGKSLVGIEVPNQTVAIVGLREILESSQFKKRGSNLTVCLGKDVAGQPWVAELGKMPHMLVAGATGSGKTVCLNTIILSLLYQNNPDDLKLILIDPKRVELPTYNGIPHLLTPAITEVPKTINALKWAISEMDRRFEVLSTSGKRDLASYNQVAEERIPYIVIIIDELADLMVASAAEVESSIIRLAQMARAVGIHLVVATQRPSVDVITGLIKANITTRIAFSVASSMDSRTILDTPGAEKLVGRGDMLYMSAELSKPKRIQCGYVSDNDIRKVVNFITAQLDEPVQYTEGITEKKSGFTSGGSFDDTGDDLFEEAKTTVVRAGKASASYLQRRLKIGYARAARLLDLLEERGIIGPGDGAKPRDVLVSPIDGEPPARFDENE